MTLADRPSHCSFATALRSAVRLGAMVLLLAAGCGRSSPELCAGGVCGETGFRATFGTGGDGPGTASGPTSTSTSTSSSSGGTTAVAECEPECTPGTFCEPESDRCVECLHSGQCADTEFCSTSFTCDPLPGCMVNADCPNRYICNGGECIWVGTCFDDSDCPAGQECFGGWCNVAGGCRSHNECPPGQACLGQECTPWP